jgi:putative tricarboxylic transport membrane protein
MRGNVDVYSGLLLLAISTLALWLASSLSMGDAMEMGPGYFPTVISAVLGIISIAITIRGLVTPGQDVAPIELRPLAAVVASFVVFALLLPRAGLAIAIAAQVGVAHFGSSETRVLESVMFAVGLAAFSAVLFIRVLGIPVRLFP